LALGQNGLFENFTLGDSSEGSGLVILTNAGTGLKICNFIVRHLTGQDHPAFLWL
jgi:hypothetical protein